MFVELNLLPCYEEFSKTMDTIFKIIGNDSPFVLNLIPIRGTIHKKYIDKIVNNSDSKFDDSIGILKKHSSMAPVTITPIMLCKRFGYWIDQRKHISGIDESILNEYKNFYPFYSTKIE